MNKYRQIFFGFLTAFVLICLSMTVYKSQQYMDRQREIRFVNRLPVFLPNGKVLKALSMGHYALLADYYWIQSVIYFGRRTIDHDNMYYLYDLYDGDVEKMEQVQGHHAHFHSHNESYKTQAHDEEDLKHFNRMEHFKDNLEPLQKGRPVPPDSIPFVDTARIPAIFEFPAYGLMNYISPLIDRVTILDPYFKTPYIFSTIAILAETGQIDWVISLLEYGYKKNPDVWIFPFYLGYVHWMYKADTDTMISYLREAVQKPGCRPYVRELLAGFLQESGRKEVIRLYFESLMETTDNPEIKEQIMDVLDRLKPAS